MRWPAGFRVVMSCVTNCWRWHVPDAIPALFHMDLTEIPTGMFGLGGP